MSPDKINVPVPVLVKVLLEVPVIIPGIVNEALVSTWIVAVLLKVTPLFESNENVPEVMFKVPLPIVKESAVTDPGTAPKFLSAEIFNVPPVIFVFP